MKEVYRLISVFLLLWNSALLAAVAEIPVEALEPTREQRQSTLYINKAIRSFHYKKQPLDDGLSVQILDRYLESLDPNKSYFTQQDIESFTSYRDRLDDALRWTNLDPAFRIFRVFRQRAEQRYTHALALLDKKYDFTVDEEYLFNREDEPWVADEAAMAELWRKRVKNDILSLRLTEKKPEEIIKTLRKRYEGALHRIRQMDSDDVYTLFINSYTLTLEPHTSFMSPRAAENFDISMRLSLEGIGAVLQMENEYTEVQRVIPGGPAAQSGEIGSGDRIVGVAQGKEGEMVDVVGWRLQDVVDLIRGTKGTVVQLEILPKETGTAGPAKTVTMVRNEIKLEDQAAQSSIIEGLPGMGASRIGVIDLPTFYRDFQGYSQGNEDFRSTTRDVRELLKKLQAQKVDGIVIDLRQNGGGSLIEATELTGLFIPSGPVVQVKNSSGEIDVETDPDPQQVYDGPLAVLVDRYSASASEIFAGAIQDYGRGIIIGEPTFGKGTVQSLIDLDRFAPDPDTKLGRLRITMAQFFRVNGGSTQFMGVEPDIRFPMAEYSGSEGERSLDNALPWAEIKPASHQTYKIGSLEHARRLHEKRIQSDLGFQFLLEQEKELKEIREEKQLSLQEQTRREEWDQQEQERRARENRFRASVGLPLISKEEKPDEKKSPEKDKQEEEAFKGIGLKEAARILADYVLSQSPRAVMAH